MSWQHSYTVIGDDAESGLSSVIVTLLMFSNQNQWRIKALGLNINYAKV